jgi:hypothetical protein
VALENLRQEIARRTLVSTPRLKTSAAKIRQSQFNAVAFDFFDLKGHVEKCYQLVAYIPSRIEGDFGETLGNHPVAFYESTFWFKLHKKRGLVQTAHKW